MPGANQRHTDLRGLGMASPQHTILYHSFVLDALSIFGEGSFFWHYLYKVIWYWWQTIHKCD